MLVQAVAAAGARFVWPYVRRKLWRGAKRFLSSGTFVGKPDIFGFGPPSMQNNRGADGRKSAPLFGGVYMNRGAYRGTKNRYGE